MQAGSGTLCKRHEANFASCASRVSTSTRNAIANTRILTARDMSEIYLAAILHRDYPRRIVRAIDGSSIGGSRGISGWVHHRAMKHSTRANARARPTYKTDYWTREGYGRASDVIKAITVIIIGGLRSSEPTNRFARWLHVRSRSRDRKLWSSWRYITQIRKGYYTISVEFFFFSRKARKSKQPYRWIAKI